MLSIWALWTLWTFSVSVWICLFHVFISGYVAGTLTGTTALGQCGPESNGNKGVLHILQSSSHYHHHHVVLVAWISLTPSRHFSLSFITLGMSSGQHPVSSHSCWMYVRAGRPAFARPCVGVHKSTSLMSSSLLLQSSSTRTLPPDTV